MWTTLRLQQERRNAEIASEATVMFLAIAGGFHGGKVAKQFQNVVKGLTDGRS